VPHADVPRWYSVIDVLAYARKSIRLTETVTPLKPLEAMAQGRPFIASNVGGHRELVRDGETGVLFRPDDPGALAESFLRLAQAPEFARRLRDAGRRFVESERTWSNSVARYEAVYQRALQKVRPA
jgi:glycosyltransferase involved in cell wall biosynthesis